MKPKYYGAKVMCLDCEEIIQSKHVHDWVSCSCFGDEKKPGGIFVDGGGEYLRMGYKVDARYKQVKAGKYRINSKRK